MEKDEHIFHCCDGNKYESLEEFRDSLVSMNEGTFRHHVQDDRNDFAQWIEDCFDEHELSEDLRLCNDAESMKHVMEDFLAENPILCTGEGCKIVIRFE